MLWIKNTSGKQDAMLSFAFFAFLVVTANIMLATFGNITYNSFEIKFASMEAASMTAYLAATFTAYVTRRWTDKKFEADKTKDKEVIDG